MPLWPKNIISEWTTLMEKRYSRIKKKKCKNIESKARKI